MSKKITSLAVALPIYTVIRELDRSIKVHGEILGTCFYLSEQFMLTAGHVVKQLQAQQHIGMVGVFEPGPSSTTQWGLEVTDMELLPCDLGLLSVQFDLDQQRNCIFAPPWKEDVVAPAHDVSTWGYPYGLQTHGDERAVIQRVFKGHIVASPIRFKLEGAEGEPFPVYELSFAAPRGLSGAPLMIKEGSQYVCGVVIGNSKTSMLIHNYEEVIEETNERTVVEHYESLSLGIAVQARAIMPLRSRMLGGTIGEYLKKRYTE